MPTTSAKPLTRESYLTRVFTKPVTLTDGAVVNIRALSASVIVNGAQDTTVFEPANLLVQSLCDADGKPLFADTEKDLAMTIDHVSLRIVMDEILKLNGLQPTNEGEPGELEKN